jgi:hyperosmotically inducible protein
MKLAQATVLALAAALGTSQLAGCASEPTSRSTGRFFDDAAITTKVKLALARDKEAPAHDINVTTYRGVVQLSGFVQTDDQARHAADVARSVEGVRDVYNDVRVAPRS